MKSLLLIEIIVIIYSGYALHTLSQLENVTPGDLERDSLIQVQDTISSSINNLKSNYYIIKAIHKDKKQAYLLVRQKNVLVATIMKNNHLIPNQQSIVKSQIKPQYLSNQRKWSFTTIFAIFGTQSELQKCYKIFYRLKIQRLKNSPSIAYLNQKRMVIEAFNSAKKKLNLALESFTDFQIKEVEDIDIKGIQLQGSDILQRQIEEEQNSSEQKVVSQKDIEMTREQTPAEYIQIKVIFKVGKIDIKQEQSSQRENTQFQNQFDEDQSDYSAESL